MQVSNGSLGSSDRRARRTLSDPSGESVDHRLPGITTPRVRRVNAGRWAGSCTSHGCLTGSVPSVTSILDSATRRVPVEFRFLGLDRRAFPFAAAAAAVWLVWAALMPAINDALPWADAVRPGDVFQLSETVTIVPPVGWGVRSGLRTTDQTSSGTASEPVQVVSGGIVASVITGPWTGTPSQLLASSEAIVDAESGVAFVPMSKVTTVTTTSGLTGVLQGVATTGVEGLVAAFVVEGTGIQLVVSGPPEQLAGHSREIGQMIASLRSSPEGGTR